MAPIAGCPGIPMMSQNMPPSAQESSILTGAIHHKQTEPHLQGLADVGELDRTLRERQIRVESRPPNMDGVEVRIPPGRIIKTYLNPVPLVPNAV